MIKVLIIEDDVTLGSAYRAKLLAEGMEVESAGDGAEAVHKAIEFNPDIILLDLMLPKLSGIEFLKAYDVKTWHTNVRVIVASNLFSEEIKKEVIDLGASSYLLKTDLSPNYLISLIKETVTLTATVDPIG